MQCDNTLEDLGKLEGIEGLLDINQQALFDCQFFCVSVKVAFGFN